LVLSKTLSRDGLLEIIENCPKGKFTFTTENRYSTIVRFLAVEGAVPAPNGTRQRKLGLNAFLKPFGPHIMGLVANYAMLARVIAAPLHSVERART